MAAAGGGVPSDERNDSKEGSFATPVVELGNNGTAKVELEGILAEHLQALQKFISVNQRLHTQLANAGLVVNVAGSAPEEMVSTMQETVRQLSKGQDLTTNSSREQRGESNTRANAQAAATLPGSIVDEIEDVPLPKKVPLPPPAPKKEPPTSPNPKLSPIMPVEQTSEREDNEETGPAAQKISERVAMRPVSRALTISINQTMEFLSKVQLFKRMPHDAYTDLASACEEVEFPEGEILIKQGDDGHEFFLIQSGKVNVLVNDQKVRVLSNGDYFGEGALLDNEVRRATVIAVEDTTCLRITREKFEELGLADKCQFARQKKLK